MTAECCESFAGTDMRGETIPDSRSCRAKTSSAKWNVATSKWANERFLITFCFPLGTPCRNNRGKCYMDRKRIQCLSNASQHIPIYLQSFLRYSELLVENCDIFSPPLFSGPEPGDPVWISRRSWYTQNQNEWAIMWWRKHDNIFSLFDTVPACDGQMDGRTDVQPISITCFSFSIADARKQEGWLSSTKRASAAKISIIYYDVCMTFY